jgi:AraC family transcriptional regulator, arabinose operon regulatory protein
MAQFNLMAVAATGGVTPRMPIGIVRCEPVWELKPYVLSDYLLWWVLDGVGQAWVEGREFPLGPGTCLILPPGSTLTALHDPKRRLRVFHMHADFLDASGRLLSPTTLALPAGPVIVNDLATFEPLARQIVEGHTAHTEAGNLKRDLALRLALLQIHEAAQFHPARTAGTSLAAALLAVRENPGTNWTVTELARRAGLSVSQTARRINELTGLSPSAFVIRARIERARQLMEESSMSLKQIAASLGYTDVYFFHRQFKSVAGITPGQWRRDRSAVKT